MSIVKQFEAIAKEYSDKTAVKTRTTELNYDSLNKRANHVAYNGATLYPYDLIYQ